MAGAFSVYRYINTKSAPDQPIARTKEIPDKIGPGGNRAILTLDNGSTINLETASTDTAIKEGITSITKQADGQLSYKLLNEKPSHNFYNRLVTPRGGQFRVILSDGTKIWLNAASSIRYPVAFTGNERKVEITGEAYFEVAKNASMPFKVKIGERAEVEVLGTHFDINAYGDESTTNTTLLEGSVKFTGLAVENSIMIVPGEQAQLNESNQIKVNKLPDAEQVISWKNGSFDFTNANLEMVMRQLARWYNVEIVFEDTIPTKRFNGEIQRTLEMSQVIRLLEKNGVHSRLEGRKLIVAD